MVSVQSLKAARFKISFGNTPNVAEMVSTGSSIAEPNTTKL